MQHLLFTVDDFILFLFFYFFNKNLMKNKNTKFEKIEQTEVILNEGLNFFFFLGSDVPVKNFKNIITNR